MYTNVELLITLIVNDDRWMINSMNHDFIVWLWEYTYDCGYKLLNGSGVAFQQTNLYSFHVIA